MIQKSGAKYDHSPETLNITSPELIASFHRAYIDAGADVVYTNTFGANSYKLGGSGHSVEEIVSAAVGIAKNAAGGAALVALDIGPVGMLCEPAGTMTFEQAYGFFKEQIEAGCDADLAEGGYPRREGELRQADYRHNDLRARRQNLHGRITCGVRVNRKRTRG